MAWLACRYKKVPDCFEVGRAPIARYSVPKHAGNRKNSNRSDTLGIGSKAIEDVATHIPLEKSQQGVL